MSYFTTKEKAFIGFSIFSLILFIAFTLSFPLIVLWSINTLLFPAFSIPYSWSTYFAMIVISWTTTGRVAYQLMKIKEKL